MLLCHHLLLDLLDLHLLVLRKLLTVHIRQLLVLLELLSRSELPPADVAHACPVLQDSRDVSSWPRARSCRRRLPRACRRRGRRRRRRSCSSISFGEATGDIGPPSSRSRFVRRFRFIRVVLLALPLVQVSANVDLHSRDAASFLLLVFLQLLHRSLSSSCCFSCNLGSRFLRRYFGVLAPRALMPFNLRVLLSFEVELEVLLCSRLVVDVGRGVEVIVRLSMVVPSRALVKHKPSGNVGWSRESLSGSNRHGLFHGNVALPDPGRRYSSVSHVLGSCV
mmetsp:Transcript_24201/g.54398  ORF Transcript_24201/g.54398 Transcript_24201/m.54398 type:complete len:279 (+) Transcript_24201:1231-2067(+)